MTFGTMALPSYGDVAITSSMDEMALLNSRSSSHGDVIITSDMEKMALTKLKIGLDLNLFFKFGFSVQSSVSSVLRESIRRSL
jgi:hypothetical protein